MVPPINRQLSYAQVAASRVLVPARIDAGMQALTPKTQGRRP